MRNAPWPHGVSHETGPEDGQAGDSRPSPSTPPDRTLAARNP